MKTAWVLLLVTHGCMYESVRVDAYNTEVECVKAMDEGKRQQGFFTEVHGQCQSVDTILKTTK